MAFFDPIRIIRDSLHELAQPLSAVTGLVDLILLKIEETHPLYREIQMIDQELSKLLQIIEEIHIIAREASGKPVSPPD